MLVDRIPVSPMREPEVNLPGYVFGRNANGRSAMRWEQAIVYMVGALMLIGVAASIFELYGAAILFGAILMILSLGDGSRIDVDHVIFATGYRVNISRVPFLAADNLGSTITERDGYPVLDEQDPEKRVFLLWMTDFFRRQLQRVAGILGIEIPEYM